MTTQNTATAAQKSEKSAPAYQALVDALRAKLTEEQVPFESWELKNFVGFKSTVNDHKFYVPKHAGNVGWCETTLAIPEVPGKIVALGKPNGKIERKVAPDLDLIMEHVAPLFLASESRLRANSKPAKKAASQATPAPTPGEIAAGMFEVAGE